MQSNPKQYWFPAKRFGWGWGLPTMWQGWLVLAAYFCMVLVGAIIVLPGRGPLAFVVYVSALSLLLVAICWIKGEPPRWRWGKE